MVISGIVSLKTTTGNMQFQMDKTQISGNTSINLQSTTGTVNMNLIENQKLSGNATVHTQTTTGKINLSIAIEDDVGAIIKSDTVVGGLYVDALKFSGNQTLLRSDNYPAESNFLVNLRTTTGGINISAIYASSVSLS